MSSFVSANDLDAIRQKRKEERRAYHKQILEKEKQKFFEQRKLQQLRKERGDDVWVAPGVSSRLGLPGEEPEKKKKKKKHRKDKKSHKKEKSVEQELDKDSDDSEGVWVELGSETTPTEPPLSNAPLERDNWMIMPPSLSGASQSRLAELAEVTGRSRKSKEEKRAEESRLADQQGQHPRELNPYWKDGGTGLPDQQLRESSSSSSSKRDTAVGDGGRSWLLRAYKRALERAEDEGRDFEEVATERWGSMEKLYTLLEEAGIDPKDPDRRPDRAKRDYLYSGHSRERRDRNEDSRRHRDEESSGERYDRRRGAREGKGSSNRSDMSAIAFKRPGEEPNRDAFHLGTSSDTKGWKRKQPSSDVSPSKPFSPPQRLQEEPIITTRSREPALISHNSPSPPPPPPPPRPSISTKPKVQVKPVSDSQLNSIAAKLMKAELMGDTSKIEKLKKQLDELRQQQEQQQHQGSTGSRDEQEMKTEEKVVLLTKTDQFGRARPVDLAEGQSRLSSQSKGRSSKYSTNTHTGKGKRNKYFADDDEYSLRSLMEQERMQTAEETQAAIARMASKFVPASNADEVVDDVMESRISVRHNPEREAEKQRQRAILENRKMTEVLENCKFCFDNGNFEKHLLLAVGLSVYLAVPPTQSLTEGHCRLVPMEHCVSSLLLDENVWSEIEIFRKGLTAMFADRELDVVFMETYTSTKRKTHMWIDCIPVPKEVGELAPMYFKKAIMESDEEWSTNRKLIDTSKKGIRGSIPLGLPYFFAEFGRDGGFGHIIENTDKFPHYFGLEVCGGLLDTEPRLWLKPPRESFEQQKRKTLTLAEWWEPYDWTQRLKTE